MPRLPERAAAQVLGILGAAAILFGSVVALCQVETADQLGVSTLVCPYGSLT